MRIFNLTRIFQVGLVQPPWILFYDLQMFAMKCIFFLFDSTAGTQSELLKQVDPKGVIEFRAVAMDFSPPVR